jgi:class 3 adenylate cyclase
VADVEADASELARRLEAAQEQQRALSRVLRAVARAEGLQPVLDEVVKSVTLLSGVENGRLWLVEGGLLHAFANQGFEDAFQYDRQHPHAIDRMTMAGRTALTRAVVHIPDILEDAEYAYAGPRPYRAALSVPILFEGELIGVIGIVRVAPGPFPEHDVELVKTFADQAAIAIANARLLEAVDRQRTELSRFLSPRVAALVSSPDGERLLAGHRAYISCLFCDLRGFTAFAETAEPEELLAVLREYHASLGELIPRYEATLEHFAGDGVMVFFNDPVPVEAHELQAIRLALAAQERFAELAAVWRKRGTELGLGIGIGAGYATLGRIGFEGRYDYGALGPVTNLASRLSTRAEPGQTLISQRVHAAVEDAVEAKPAGELELKGFGRPIVAFEVLGLRT